MHELEERRLDRVGARGGRGRARRRLGEDEPAAGGRVDHGVDERGLERVRLPRPAASGGSIRAIGPSIASRAGRAVRCSTRT